VTTFPVGGTYEPPSPGWHPAVCAEYTDSVSQFDGRTQGVWTFEVEELDSTGDRKTISLYFNQTWGTSGFPSKLRRVAEAWAGKSLSDQECADTHAEDFIGVNSEILIANNRSGKARIVNIRPLSEDAEPLLVSAGYQPREAEMGASGGFGSANTGGFGGGGFQSGFGIAA
jgi:hypothetical protein